MSNSAETQPTPEQSTPRASQQRKRQRSVIFYIFILFAAAFVLLLLSFLMERRQNAENLDNLNQSMSGLKESVSAMQSVQQLYEENAALKDQVQDLEDQLKDALNSIDGLTDTISNQEHTLEQTQVAMDYFWQIDEAYVRGRYTLCRSLIEVLEDNADGKTPLKAYLPAESATDNDRFSPADRYQEIHDALY
jgi:uncharacterized protein YoxC